MQCSGNLLLFHLPVRLLKLIRNFIRPPKRCFINSVIASNRLHRRNRYCSFRKQHNPTPIVFVANGAGGITDWFKGMVSLFDFCDRTGIEFKIHAKNKFNFEDFFSPNDYNWLLSDDDFNKLKDDSSTLHIVLSESGVKGKEAWNEQQDVLRFICFSKQVRAVFIYSVAPYGLKSFGTRFKSLFKMSDLLASSVEEMTRKIGGDYFSVSLRFVNLLRDSSEEVTGINAISETEQKQLISSCIEKLDELVNGRKDKKTLVTTDSYRFLTELDKHEFPTNTVFYLKGEEFHRHIGFSPTISTAGVLKSYTEFMLISRATEAYLIQIGSMYDSKFPKWAASINGHPYVIIRENTKE